MLAVLIVVGANAASGQAEWLKDAGGVAIPNGPVGGKINGKAVSFIRGRIEKSGGISLGDAPFEHFTIRLADAEKLVDSKFSALIMITVRKSELPDAKTYRRNMAPSPEKRAGLRGENYWVPEIYSVMMTSRRGTDLGSGTDMVSADGPDQFTGRVELDSRKNGKLAARIYVCYNDVQKSCIAGKIDLSVD